MDTAEEYSSSGEEIPVSNEGRDAAEVAKASIEKYYMNMFKALGEREKRYVWKISILIYTSDENVTFKRWSSCPSAKQRRRNA